MVSIRCELPADPRWLGVVDQVVGAAPRFVHDDVGDLDDLAIAVTEVAAEVGAAPGVHRLEVGVDGDQVEILGRGADVGWEPGPVWERLVPRLAEISSEVARDEVRIRLAPRRA